MPPDYLTVLSLVSGYVDYQALDPFESEFEHYNKIFLVHILNHVFQMKSGENEDAVVGYTQPRALILAGYRVEAFYIVQTIKSVLKKFGITKVLQWEKFAEKFGSEDVKVFLNF